MTTAEINFEMPPVAVVVGRSSLFSSLTPIPFSAILHLSLSLSLSLSSFSAAMKESLPPPVPPLSPISPFDISHLVWTAVCCCCCCRPKPKSQAGTQRGEERGERPALHDSTHTHKQFSLTALAKVGKVALRTDSLGEAKIASIRMVAFPQDVGVAKTVF